MVNLSRWRIADHNSTQGIPTVRNARSAATISASGVECDTHDCRFEMACSGIRVLGPCRAKKTPDVLRAVLGETRKIRVCEEDGVDVFGVVSYPSDHAQIN